DPRLRRGGARLLDRAGADAGRAEGPRDRGARAHGAQGGLPGLRGVAQGHAGEPAARRGARDGAEAVSTYAATVVWSRAPGAAFVDNRYSRAHEWRFDGGAVVR